MRATKFLSPRPSPKGRGRAPGLETVKRGPSPNRNFSLPCSTHRRRHSASTLLLGLGNDIMTDDAIGVRIARAARARLADCKDIAVAESTEMGLALLDLVVGFDQVVVVDAIQTGRVPAGFLHEIDSNQLPGGATRSPHFVGLGEILALGRELGLAVPKHVKIIAVEVQDPYTVGTQMTPALEDALPGAVERIVRLLADER